MSASKKRPKRKISFKVSHKKPRDPIAKEVTKRRGGPMKDRRKEQDWEDEDDYDAGNGSTEASFRPYDKRSDQGSEGSS